MTITECFELGYRDALSACRESGEFSTPDGGWTSWLINGVGIKGTYEALGEPYAEEFDWSKAMRAKLAAYNEGGVRGAEAAREEAARE